jgi:hypothetical protein
LLVQIGQLFKSVSHAKIAFVRAKWVRLSRYVSSTYYAIIFLGIFDITKKSESIAMPDIKTRENVGVSEFKVFNNSIKFLVPFEAVLDERDVQVVEDDLCLLLLRLLQIQTSEMAV